jgi:NitT/TauT family transport system substrate-binding protein
MVRTGLKNVGLVLVIAGFFIAVSWRMALQPAGRNGTTMAAQSATTTPASNADTIILQLHWLPQAQFAGYVMALEKGFYREHGLRGVKIGWAGAGDSPLTRLAEGKADFCTAFLSQAVDRCAKGMKIVDIAQIMQKSAMMLVARADSGIKIPADINGKRVQMWGGDFEAQPRAFFKKFKIIPEVIPQGSSIVPFLRGAVPVVSAMYYNEYHKLLEAGLTPNELQPFLFSDYGMDFPEDGLYCTSKTRRDRPAVCRAMAAAVIEGWAYALANEAETLDVVMRYCDRAHTGTNRNHQRWMLRAMGQFIRYRVGDNPKAWGDLSRAEYEKVGRVLQEEKIIKTIPSFESFYQPAKNRGTQ